VQRGVFEKIAASPAAQVAEPLGYLIKPFREQELYTNIQTIMEKVEIDHQSHRQHQRAATRFRKGTATPRRIPIQS
jgi:FixJ family two-component response regulator